MNSDTKFKYHNGNKSSITYILTPIKGISILTCEQVSVIELITCITTNNIINPNIIPNEYYMNYSINV